MKKKTNKSELKDAFASIKDGEEHAKRTFDLNAKAFNASHQNIKMTDFQRETANLLYKMSATALSFQHYCVDILDMFVHEKITAEQCAMWIRGEHFAVDSINKMVYNLLQTFDNK